MDSQNEPSSSEDKSTQQTETQHQLDLTKAKVEEVVDIMRINVERIVERGTNLNEVDQRADALNASALQFQDQSSKLKRKHWLANVKMRIAIALIVVGVIIIAVVWSVYG